jgi:hypothetical protein
VYELNKTELLKDVFIHAYTRSASRYATMRQTLGEPDSFRLKYRDQIRDLIRNIIIKVMSNEQASASIKTFAASIPDADREKFIESVETELLNLHQGNFARYRVRPSEFNQWKEVWKSITSS